MSDENFWETNGKEWIRILNEQKIASRPVTNKALLIEVLSIKPFSVLDIGCGEGWLAHALPESIKYFGVDGSQPLIEDAQCKNTKQSFAVVSYDKISSKSWVLEGKIDVLVFNFSLLDKEIGSLLQNSADFLNPGGRAIVQTLHPFFAVQEYTDKWNEDDFSTLSSDIKGKMPWYQRTLPSWCDVFKSAGFVVEKITEPLFNGKPASMIFTLKRS